MDYKVIITENAQEDMDRFVRYLLFEKRNEQVASNLIDNFEETIAALVRTAGGLKMYENQYLRELGYRRISFMSRRYFMHYRVKTFFS